MGGRRGRYPGGPGERGLLTVQSGDTTGDSDFSTGLLPLDPEVMVEYRVGGTASALVAEGMVLGYIDRHLA